jgi:hypothetical protein
MSETWAPDDRGQLATIARNLATRYVAIAIEMVLGLLLLPFNLRHLGPETRAVWPAVWPALILAACLIPMRGISSGTLLAVFIEGTIAAAAYLAFFFLIAVGRRDRANYLAGRWS